MTVMEYAMVASVAISIASLAFAVISARDKAKSTKVRELEHRVNGKADNGAHVILAAKVDALEDRATRIEKDIQSLPDRKSVHDMELSIERLGADVRVLTEQIKPIAAVSNRLQEVMLRDSRA